jgi:hypothetical protein
MRNWGAAKCEAICTHPPEYAEHSIAGGMGTNSHNWFRSPIPRPRLCRDAEAPGAALDPVGVKLPNEQLLPRGRRKAD